MADTRTGSAAVGSRIEVRRADQRFHTQTNWLDSYHSFSFGPHFDPSNMGFGTLRVLNDDIIAPGQGFGTHPHRDMEIVTWVVKGAVAHQDSSGGPAVARNAGRVAVRGLCPERAERVPERNEGMRASFGIGPPGWVRRGVSPPLSAAATPTVTPATPAETTSLALKVAWGAAAWKMAGMMSPTSARVSEMACMPATLASKVCS